MRGTAPSLLLAALVVGVHGVALNPATDSLGPLVPGPAMLQVADNTKKGFGFGMHRQVEGGDYQNNNQGLEPPPPPMAGGEEPLPPMAGLEEMASSASGATSGAASTAASGAASAASGASAATSGAASGAASGASGGESGAEGGTSSSGMEPAEVIGAPPTQPDLALAPATIDFNVGPGAAPMSDVNAVEPEYRNPQGHNVMLLVPGHLPLVLPYGTKITLPGVMGVQDGEEAPAEVPAEDGYGNANINANAVASGDGNANADAASADDGYEDLSSAGDDGYGAASNANAPADDGYGDAGANAEAAAEEAAANPEAPADDGYGVDAAAAAAAPAEDGYGDPDIEFVQKKSTLHRRVRRATPQQHRKPLPKAGPLASEIADAISSLEL